MNEMLQKHVHKLTNHSECVHIIKHWISDVKFLPRMHRALGSIPSPALFKCDGIPVIPVAGRWKQDDQKFKGAHGQCGLHETLSKENFIVECAGSHL